MLINGETLSWKLMVSIVEEHFSLSFKIILFQLKFTRLQTSYQCLKRVETKLSITKSLEKQTFWVFQPMFVAC